KMAGLDDLDLDDMFNDDGDMLFEGLDLELDGMGDIISNEKKEMAATAPPPPRRTGGPRTKRTNPMLEAEEGDAGKRRKTKRKSKVPFDEDFIDEQPKKKRKAALKAKKATEPIVKTKRKKKTDGSVPLPSPTAFGGPSMNSKTKSSGPTVAVAAAGQFGGRVKRGSVSSMGTTKVKRKMKKSADASEMQAQGNLVLAPPPLLPPRPEPIFGGLAPSKTLFYPFLEAVPPEASLQKRKTYPTMDRISSTLTSQMSNTSSSTPSAAASQNPNDPKADSVVTEDSPIFKLMLEAYENDKDKNPNKKETILKAIPHVKDLIKSQDSQKLVCDVFSMCWLLTRQYNFSNQSLENMHQWCKDEFSEEDYKATFEVPAEKPKFNKWKSPVVKLKVSFYAYKEPKGAPSLQGILPPMVVEVPKQSLAAMAAASKMKAAEAKKASAGIKATTTTKLKKQKGKPTDKSKAKGSAAASAPTNSAPAPRTYANSNPQSRRQQVMESIARVGVELENAQKADNLGASLQSIPEEDPPLQTSRMWEFLQRGGFYKHPASKRLDLKSPEIHPRGLFLRPATKIHGSRDTDQKSSSYCLFDRLQSMLVDEDQEDDNGEETGDSDSVDSDTDVSLGFLNEDDEDLEEEGKRDNEELDTETAPDIVDLSQLSQEERTFIQLSYAGLIRKSLFPSVDLVLSRERTEKEEEAYAAQDEIVNVIGAMSSDLSRMTSTNNKRISYLESATADPDLHYSKQTEDQHASIIARCNAMMKRTKERAKKAKQKKDENLNLPW
ncbi:MAG: hypothetical protein SGILL_005117, partial [Bacillariaceae sp.]